MKYQRKYLGEESQKWLNLETSTGTNDQQIKRQFQTLKLFLRSYDSSERQAIAQFTGLDLPALLASAITPNKATLRLLLVKSFIDKNNPLLLAEAMRITGRGKALEKRIFFSIAKKLFEADELPVDLYAYSVYRRMGSPATWLQAHEALDHLTCQSMLENSISRICKRLTYIKKQKHSKRFSVTIGDLTLVILDKSSHVDVAKAEKKNREIQRVVYLMIVYDQSKRRIGVVSHSKSSIAIIQKFFKTKLFPEKLFVIRNDTEVKGKALYEKLVFVDEDATPIQVMGLGINHSNLPSAPSFQLEASSEKSITNAISDVRQLIEGQSIEDIKNVSYDLDGKRFSVYSYGDDWSRRIVRVGSKGKTTGFENLAYKAIGDLLGHTIRETRFVTEKKKEAEIIDMIMRDGFIATEPAPPEYVEKFVVELVEKGMFQEPRRVKKRICSDFYNCRTSSWKSWHCPKCSRSMVFSGEIEMISIWEVNVVRNICDHLAKQLGALQIEKKSRERAKIRKPVIQIFDPVTRVCSLVLFLTNRKDIKFLKRLSMEGCGLVAICSPQLSNRLDEIKGYGCDVVDLSEVLYELLKVIRGDSSGLSKLLGEALKSQTESVLKRIYGQLKVSVENLLKRPVAYNEDMFEIDIKNILQALVPNVVRLGTESKGKKVPDGYCSFQLPGKSRSNLMGWDAKFSTGRDYKLGGRDLKKQKGYIEYLSKNKEPKSSGLLTIYSFISNFHNIKGFKTVLTKLGKWVKKPWNCRIILIEDALIAKLGEWVLQNWKKVLSSGPMIAKIFFIWIRSNNRKKYSRWLYMKSEHWPDLEAELKKI